MLKDYLDRPKPQNPPKGWEPKKEVGSDKLTLVTEGYDAEEFQTAENLAQEDIDKILEKNNLTPGAWEITSWSQNEWDGKKGFRLTAKPSNAKFGVTMPSLDAIVSGMKKSKVKKPKDQNNAITVVGLLADAQVGKVDINGGTEELIERLDEKLERWEAYLAMVAPQEIVIADMGDGIENFENTAQQARTNDLGLVDQIDLFGFFRWKWIDVAAKYAPLVRDVSMPSNHTAVRRGRDVLGAPDDDYGLLVQRFLKRQAEMVPDKYGHVSFHAPNKWEESLTIQTLSGHNLGFVHGHQVNQPHLLDDWWYKQIAARGPLQYADTLNYGHFHHLFLREGRGGKKIIGAPSVDNGSAWIRNLQGSNSKAGVLTYTVDSTGPFDWKVC